jgi:hypothetical protein
MRASARNFNETPGLEQRRALSLSHLTYRATITVNFHRLDHPPFPCTHRISAVSRVFKFAESCTFRVVYGGTSGGHLPDRQAPKPAGGARMLSRREFLHNSVMALAGLQVTGRAALSSTDLVVSTVRGRIQGLAANEALPPRASAFPPRIACQAPQNRNFLIPRPIHAKIDGFELCPTCYH